MVSGTAVEQRRIADREQQLHHAEAAALAAETRAQLNARQNEPRAIDLKSIGENVASTDKPVGSETSVFSSRRTVAPWMLTREEEWKKHP